MTLKQSVEWLGPLPQSSLTIVDPPWRRSAPSAGNEILLERTPWWSAATSMTPEIAVARGVSRRAWAAAMPASNLPPWFVGALIELSARRAVEPLFESENLPPGHAFLEARFFGGFVPRFLRIRLLAEADGDPLPAYRARPGVNPTRRPRRLKMPGASKPRACWRSRRWSGGSVVRSTTRSLANSSGCRATSARTSPTSNVWRPRSVARTCRGSFRRRLNRRSSSTTVSSALSSDADPDGTFQTRVVARRYGDALFTGSSAAPVGRFEAGRGVEVLVRFADGQQRIDYWDGRAREKEFRYRSPARAVSAMVDPDRKVLLDLRGPTTAGRWRRGPAPPLQCGRRAT